MTSWSDPVEEILAHNEISTTLGRFAQERLMAHSPQEMPLAVVSDSGFVHPEHLNTPRLVADATGSTVWRWDQAEPFGVTVPDENPSGLGAFDLPLRLPGQYFDKESFLHYNVFRDYDPSLGIYKQSDPIGLRGGPNTYLYVHATPLRNTDPFGLYAMEAETIAMAWILRQPPSQAAQEVGEQAGRNCALKVPCGAGQQSENHINDECKFLLPAPGGTRGAIVPVAFNACVATCQKEWFKRCNPPSKVSCLGAQG